MRPILRTIGAVITAPEKTPMAPTASTSAMPAAPVRKIPALSVKYFWNSSSTISVHMPKQNRTTITTSTASPTVGRCQHVMQAAGEPLQARRAAVAPARRSRPGPSSISLNLVAISAAAR